MIAALYIDPRGPYPKLADASWGEQSPGRVSIDCWGTRRDARLYAGPHPVVAHPPCKHWGRLRHLAKDTKCAECDGYGCVNPGRWERTCPMCNGVGRWSDRDCAPRAVEQVRAYGGVLEHPAGSRLWEACGLPKPIPWDGDRSSWPDVHGGYTIEVDQVEWGHVARKRTWLYLVGVPREALEAPPFPGREPTHHVSRDAKRAARNGYTLKRTGSKQNLLTPPLFAEYLVRLARAAKRDEV